MKKENLSTHFLSCVIILDEAWSLAARLARCKKKLCAILTIGVAIVAFLLLSLRPFLSASFSVTPYERPYGNP
jgi:hypothetical protein